MSTRSSSGPRTALAEAPNQEGHRDRVDDEVPDLRAVLRQIADWVLVAFDAAGAAIYE